ncbi:MAG: hypothetical protein K0A89_04895 [ANME-2 cluster archaeon]|nr:hypothetical protein [ANME-2 cluster archaeon]
MKNITHLMLLCLISSVLISGCLETKEAVPATVNQTTLDELGWAQYGEIVTDTMVQDVAGMEMTISTAMVTYRDEKLMGEMLHQLDKLLGAYGISASGSGEGPFASQFIIIRVAFPGGISIPESMLSSIIDNQIQSMTQESNIQGFQEVSQEKVTLNSGSTVTARSFEGYIKSGDKGMVSVKVRSVLAAWSDDGMSTIVVGLIPADDLVIRLPTDMRSSGTFTIEIDEAQEYQNILTLIKNVE